MRKLYLLIALFWTTSVVADVIYLRNNRVIRGRIIEVKTDRYLVEIPGGKMWINMKDIDRLVEEKPHQYYLKQAQRLYLLKDYELAVQHFRKVLPRHRYQVRRGIRDCLFQIGLKDFDRRHFLRSQKTFQKVVQQFPTYPPAHLQLQKIDEIFARRKASLAQAQKQLSQRKYIAADRSLVEAQKLVPLQASALLAQRAQVYRQWGELLYRKKRYSQAAQKFYRAMIYHPPLLDQYIESYISGRMYDIRDLIQKRKYKQALSELTSLEYLDPNHLKVKYFRAVALHGQRKLVKASDIYYQLLGEKPPQKKPINIVRLQKRAEARVLSPLPSQPSKKATVPAIEGKKWLIKKSKLFTIYHRNQALAKDVEKRLLFYYKKYVDALSPASSGKTFLPPAKVYLHPTRKSYLSQVPPGYTEHGYRKIKTHIGSIHSLEFHTYTTAPSLRQYQIPYHLGHLFFANVYPYQKVVPHWVKESFALAMCHEVIRRHHQERMWLLVQTHYQLDMKEFTLQLTRPQPPADFPTLSLSAFSFLVEGKKKQEVLKFFALCTRESPEKALLAKWNLVNLQHFKNEWFYWARRNLEKSILQPPSQ